MISDILLIGASVEALSTIKSTNYNTVAIVDPNLKSNTWNNIRVFHNVAVAREKTSVENVVLAIDNINNRKVAYKSLKNLSMNVISIKGGYIGENVEIGPGAFLQRLSHLSDNCILGIGSRLNINCNVMHDTVIGNFVTVAPNATILGRVIIGNETYIGANATILPDIKIGQGVIIGAGSVVTKNIEDKRIVKGNPAK